MGELNLHNLTKYVDGGCEIFVETGTGRGTGLEHAKKYKFKQLFSIEIIRQLWKECLEKFKDDSRIHLLHNNSILGIREVFDYVNEDAPILWWLDAHFPGADFQMGSYDDDHPKHIKNPLEDEVKLITSGYRNFSKDVFIMDDLGLYEPGNYQFDSARLAQFRSKLGLNNKFIYDTLEATHTFRKDYRHQGFLILEPKGT